jgi:hypothetical protein
MIGIVRLFSALMYGDLELGARNKAPSYYSDDAQ